MKKENHNKQRKGAKFPKYESKYKKLFEKGSVNCSVDSLLRTFEFSL